MNSTFRGKESSYGHATLTAARSRFSSGRQSDLLYIGLVIPEQIFLIHHAIFPVADSCQLDPTLGLVNSIDSAFLERYSGRHPAN